MTIRWKHLIGRPFVHGVTDCYSLVRDFYHDNYGIELTDYARPDGWWDKGLNLYMDYFPNEGFRQVDFNPLGLREGDLLLSSIMAKVPNHAAIYIGGGRVLHHLPNRPSRSDPFGGVLRNRLCAVIRHKDLDDDEPLGTLP